MADSTVVYGLSASSYDEKGTPPMSQNVRRDAGHLVFYGPQRTGALALPDEVELMARCS